MSGTRSWRILVVEDDADGQEVMSTILEHQHVAIDIAGDADEAERFLFESGTAYNAVIIDLALPGKDGWELLRDIQGNSNTDNLPCIAVTAFHTSKMREEALNAGFVAYFAKPVDPTSFGRALQVLL